MTPSRTSSPTRPSATTRPSSERTIIPTTTRTTSSSSHWVQIHARRSGAASKMTASSWFNTCSSSWLGGVTPKRRPPLATALVLSEQCRDEVAQLVPQLGEEPADRPAEAVDDVGGARRVLPDEVQHQGESHEADQTHSLLHRATSS